MNSRLSLRVNTVGARSRKVGGTVIGRAREVRPLDRFHSIKVKLGVLVVASVSVAGIFTAIGVSAGIQARYVVSVAVILSLGVTQILAHGMTSPLRSMADAVERIARGDYSRRVTTATGRDEVGQLASAFNLMAADLEAVDRQRKELIANVSHELRTPISALRAVLENVVDGVTEPDPPTMRLALEQAERLGRLVNTLLDLSRIDAGAVELDREDVALEEFLGTVAREATVSMLAKDAGHRRPHTVVDVVPPELTVRADRERLHQVAANLLDNAVRHSPAGGRVTLRARRLEAGGVRVEVCDQGPGIPPGERVRVFDRFDRGSRQAADGGTGLGLAIARWVVDLHGGRISVAEPGEQPAGGEPAAAGVATGAAIGASVGKPARGPAGNPVGNPAGNGVGHPMAAGASPGCVIRVDLP
ncbi:HAMP domain-containing histidine kinase [Catenulispora sp. NF23]|uniref:histidine kinase n=1 Tax=Catenulispora pinistramenti TaxID=2705254 RepID=A0ABS5L4Q9_9ACTN|nr:HAMP domain-containing sensor histidine kinase [Catenulispora pinistramenti]MBS2537491.1 HAMP domain-containing histidine kinase [Catenulispora pinistramenti]MBS2553340.1 HAMP domain-containing histidine kinase [Catenulispora pinistramenti]